MLHTNDTIAAIATPPGAGGIAILRLSGPDSVRIASRMFSPKLLKSHRLEYGHIAMDGEPIDEAMAVLMRAPRSYTREDVVELHCHGGDYVCRRVLGAAIALGARPAEPGEFTRRAFENGRIDLAQAEATMRLIGATGEAAARAALRQMDGAVSREIRAVRQKLTGMLAEIAACTDFPDEVEEVPTARKLLREAEALFAQLVAACDARASRVLEQGLSVVICGKPNVGKSSLLNALLGEPLAIVTAEAGTTRDAVRGHLELAGIRVTLTDTAGLRETAGEAEAIGIERARAAIRSADLVLVLLDGSAEGTKEDSALLEQTAGQARLVLISKADLPPGGIGPETAVDLAISAETGEGIDALRGRLEAFARGTRPGDALLTESRHMEAALRAAGSVADMAESLAAGRPVDLASIDALVALRALSEITGESAEESVINAVFREFCVGK